MYILYVHINKENNKKYYGITSQKPRERWGERGQRYTSTKRAFGEAVKKYGWNNFEHKIIADDLTAEEAKWCEQYYIARDKTNILRWGEEAQGYNMTDGGDLNNGQLGRKQLPRTPEWCAHISESLKGRVSPMKGKHHNIETKKKISESEKGKKISEETKTKISEAIKDNYNQKRKNKKEKRTPKEPERSMNAAHEARKKKVRNKETKEIFESATMASRSIKKADGYVSLDIRLKKEKSIWEFVKEE